MAKGKLIKMTQGQYSCVKCSWKKKVRGDPENLANDANYVNCPRCGCAVELTLFGPRKAQQSQIMEWPWPQQAQA